MASPVTPCDSCGSPIPDSDLETGSAVTLLGKRYCAGCKTEAIQNVSLEDLAPKAVPVRPAAPKPAAPRPATRPVPPLPEKTAPRPAPPARSEPPASAERRPPPRRAPAAKTPARSPVVLIAAVLVVLVAISVAVVLFYKGGSSSAPKGGSGAGVSGPIPPTPPVDRTVQAREAYAKVEDLSQRSGTSWDLLLAAAERAKAACKGTEWEKKLEEIRSRAAREKEADEASRDLNPLIDELKGAVATDQDFKRYAELQPKFQLALDMAAKTGSVKRDEIRALQRDYNGRYEKLAEPYYADIHEAATQLAQERRYDDAIRKINTFPQQLRHSGAWMLLDKLRLDLEARKKQSPPKK